MKISEVKDYKYNAKNHDKDQIENLKKSIEAFGFLVPVILDKNNVLITGHARIRAVKELGWTEMRENVARAKKGEKFVPFFYADDLTPEEIASFRLADNKLNESSWNYDNLKIEVANIDNLIGFDADELDMIVNRSSDELNVISEIAGGEFGNYTKDLIDHNKGQEGVEGEVLQGDISGIRFPVTFWFETEELQKQVLAFFSKNGSKIGVDEKKLLELIGL